MKKKVLLSAFAVICLLVCVSLLCGCAEEHIHTFGEWTVVKKPTCTENGEQERLCSCGEKQTQSIPATGHTFGEWQTSKEPTCTEAGEEERLCACGERQTQTIAATGHVFGEWKTSVAPTCTEAGEEERLCACGERQTQTIAATGVHIYGEWQISKEPTCTEAGEEECLCICGERQTRTVAAKGHSFGEWKTVKAATCTESGTQERTCKCGEKQTQTIAATGHTFSAWKTVKAATCTSDGTQERTCKCGEKQTQTISATGHSWKAATCTAPKTCTKCKATEGKALGHTVTVGKCTRCNTEIYPEVKLPTLGTYAYFTNVTDNVTVFSKVKITSVRYEYDDHGNLCLYCDGEKTYDEYGNSGNKYVYWSCKIYDDGGFVIYSDDPCVLGLSVGEKFKNKEIKIHSYILKEYPSSYYKVIFEDHRS